MSKGRRRRIPWCLHCNHDRSSPRGRSVHQMGAPQSQLNAPLKRYTWCLQRHAYRCIRLLQRQTYNARAFKFSPENTHALWNLSAALSLLVHTFEARVKSAEPVQNIQLRALLGSNKITGQAWPAPWFDLKLGSQINIFVRPRYIKK